MKTTGARVSTIRRNTTSPRTWNTDFAGLVPSRGATHVLYSRNKTSTNATMKMTDTTNNVPVDVPLYHLSAEHEPNEWFILPFFLLTLSEATIMYPRPPNVSICSSPVWYLFVSVCFFFSLVTQIFFFRCSDFYSKLFFFISKKKKTERDRKKTVLIVIFYCLSASALLPLPFWWRGEWPKEKKRFAFVLVSKITELLFC